MKRSRQETYEPRKRPKITSLIEAVERNYVKGVKESLDDGADLHTYDDYALRWASKNGNAEVVSLLLNVGANVHARDDYALRWASEKGHVEVVSLLLDDGANVHANDDCALRWASEQGHAEVVSLLLNVGANVNVDDDYVLRLASYNEDVEVCYLFLSSGANPEKCSKEMLAKVKERVCSQLMDIDLPTCLKNNVICDFLIGQ